VFEADSVTITGKGSVMGGLHVRLCRDLSANFVQPAVGAVLQFAR
jgi:hypothetical protein